MEHREVVQHTSEVPSIFQYEDYRDFLRDFFWFKKSKDKKFSFRFFSMRAKLKSYNYLKYVIDKKRHISHKFISHFLIALNLPERQGKYFRLLWEYDLEKDEARKKHLYLDLVRLKHSLPLYLIEEAKLEYISHWLYVALREFFHVNQHTRDISVLARLFDQPVTKIKHAIRLLKRLQLIEETEDGFKPNNGSIKVDDDLQTILVKESHRHILNEAQQKLDKTTRDERELGYLIAGINTENLPQLKRMIRKFLIEMNEEVEKASSKNRIYQLGIQLIPISHPIPQGGASQ